MAEATEGQSAAGTSIPTLVPMGQHAGKPAIALKRPVLVIGSRKNAHLHLVSRSVSKAHALLISDEAGVYLRDLASRTGVYVNGQPAREAMLADGDLIKIGKFTFQFSAPGFEDPEAPAEASYDGKLAVEGEGTTIPVNQRVVLIGQRPNCDLPLANDAEVSTAHAVVFSMNGKRYIRDLGSRTGTHVNGMMVRQVELSEGDTIRIGGTALEFELAEPGEEVPAPSPMEDEGFLAAVESELDEAAVAKDSAPERPVEVEEEPLPARGVEDETGTDQTAALDKEVAEALDESAGDESAGVEPEGATARQAVDDLDLTFKPEAEAEAEKEPEAEAEVPVAEEVAKPADDEPIPLEDVDDLAAVAEKSPAPAEELEEQQDRVEKSVAPESPAAAADSAERAGDEAPLSVETEEPEEKLSNPQQAADVQDEAEGSAAGRDESASAIPVEEEEEAEAEAPAERSSAPGVSDEARDRPDESLEDDVFRLSEEDSTTRESGGVAVLDQETLSASGHGVGVEEPADELAGPLEKDATRDEIDFSDLDLDLGEEEAAAPSAEAGKTRDDEDLGLSPAEPLIASDALELEEEPEAPAREGQRPAADERQTPASAEAPEAEIEFPAADEDDESAMPLISAPEAEALREQAPAGDQTGAEAEVEPATEVEPKVAAESEAESVPEAPTEPVAEARPPEPPAEVEEESPAEAEAPATAPEPPVEEEAPKKKRRRRRRNRRSKKKKQTETQAGGAAGAAEAGPPAAEPSPGQPPDAQAGDRPSGPSTQASAGNDPLSDSGFGLGPNQGGHLGGTPLQWRADQAAPPGDPSAEVAAPEQAPRREGRPIRPVPFAKGPFDLSPDDVVSGSLQDEIPPYTGEGPATAGRVTQAFDGLAMPPVREVDVFSEQPAPGEDDPVLGDLIPSDDDDDSSGAQKKGAKGQSEGAADSPSSPVRPSEPEGSPAKQTGRGGRSAPVRKGRGPTLRSLLLLMLLSMVAASAAIYTFVPLRSVVEAALTYENLPETILQQREFQAQQKQLLQSEEVRQAALAILERRSPELGGGFLGDSIAFVQATDRVSWPEENGAMVLPISGSDPDGDVQRAQAVLQALYRANADRIDAAANQRRELADRQDAVDRAKRELERLQRRVDEEMALAENRPTPDELRALEEEVASRRAAWQEAMVAVREAEAELELLRRRGALGRMETTPLVHGAEAERVFLDGRLRNGGWQIWAVEAEPADARLAEHEAHLASLRAAESAAQAEYLAAREALQEAEDRLAAARAAGERRDAYALERDQVAAEMAALSDELDALSAQPLPPTPVLPGEQSAGVASTEDLRPLYTAVSLGAIAVLFVGLILWSTRPADAGAAPFAAVHRGPLPVPQPRPVQNGHVHNGSAPSPRLPNDRTPAGV